MKVEHIAGNSYRICLGPVEYKKLISVANTFHKGNKAVTINECISEGLDVSLSVKALLEDEAFQKQRKCPYCERLVMEVNKTFKGMGHANIIDTKSG